MRIYSLIPIPILVLCLMPAWGVMALAERQGCRLPGKTAASAFPDDHVEDLACAAGKGDVAAMKAAIEAGADVNYRGEDGVRPLYWALYSENKRGFEALLELGADPLLGARRQHSLVETAAAIDDPDYLRIFLDHGLDPNTPIGQYQKPAIFEAIMHGRWPQLEMLLEYCYNLNWVDDFGRTAAVEAVSISKMKMAHHLVEQGLTHYLEDLAWDVENDRRNPPEQAEYREKLMRLLEEEHGITFPAPRREPGNVFPPPSPPAYAQSCLDRRERLGLGPPDGATD